MQDKEKTLEKLGGKGGNVIMRYLPKTKWLTSQLTVTG